MIGVVVFGLSPIAVNLDPLLGTSGCTLLASPDFLDFGVTDGAGQFSHTLLTTNAFAFQSVRVQHAVVETFFNLFDSSATNGLDLQF
jgi:hypothetical protein